MTTLEFLSQDREARMLCEMRQKALHDLRSMTEGAEREKALEVARNPSRTGLKEDWPGRGKNLC